MVVYSVGVQVTFSQPAVAARLGESHAQVTLFGLEAQGLDCEG